MDDKHFSESGFSYFWNNILKPMLDSIKNLVSNIQSKVSTHDTSIDEMKKKQDDVSVSIKSVSDRIDTVDIDSKTVINKLSLDIESLNSKLSNIESVEIQPYKTIKVKYVYLGSNEYAKNDHIYLANILTFSTFKNTSSEVVGGVPKLNTNAINQNKTITIRAGIYFCFSLILSNSTLVPTNLWWYIDDVLVSKERSFIFDFQKDCTIYVKNPS